MAVSYSGMQKRIIRHLIRRNTQGWGRPLAFTEQRLRLGSWMGLVALVALSIFLAFNSHGGSVVATIFGMIGIFLLVLCLGVLWYALPAYWRARSEPAEQVTGTVSAAICDVAEQFPFTRDPYHFVTLRLPNGKLRALAVDPQLHEQLCEKGKHISLTITPGIERIITIA